jgi:protein-S-isoprenylcysteine O-methyltransferase Ste14
VRATLFEFKYRFYLFTVIFALGFSLYWPDHTNAAVALLLWLRPGLNLDSSRGLFWIRFVFLCGALLVCAAALLRTWATAYLRGDIVHDDKLHSEALVADGPFRFVRNPLYLAGLPMSVGLGLMASRAGFLFIVACVALLHFRLILREESELLRSQGESYRAYLRAVPRLLPALRPRVPSAGGAPHWGQAFASESFMWLLAIATLTFAGTLKTTPTLIIVVASILLNKPIAALLRKHAAASEANSTGRSSQQAAAGKDASAGD